MTEAEKFLDDLRTGVCYVVINTCYGGFGLSDRAKDEYMKLAGLTETDFHDRDLPRDDPYLVKVVKELGTAANGGFANLKIVEVPGNVKWHIGEYDGTEWVAEDHRTWS
jgi:hypothetical protein